MYVSSFNCPKNSIEGNSPQIPKTAVKCREYHEWLESQTAETIPKSPLSVYFLYYPILLLPQKAFQFQDLWRNEASTKGVWGFPGTAATTSGAKKTLGASSDVIPFWSLGKRKQKIRTSVRWSLVSYSCKLQIDLFIFIYIYIFIFINDYISILSYVHQIFPLPLHPHLISLYPHTNISVKWFVSVAPPSRLLEDRRVRPGAHHRLCCHPEAIGSAHGQVPQGAQGPKKTRWVRCFFPTSSEKATKPTMVFTVTLW